MFSSFIVTAVKRSVLPAVQSVAASPGLLLLGYAQHKPPVPGLGGAGDRGAVPRGQRGWYGGGAPYKQRAKYRGCQARHSGGTSNTRDSWSIFQEGEPTPPPRHTGWGRPSTAFLICTPSQGNSPHYHHCRTFPLHSFSSYTARVLFLMQHFLIFLFFCLWSSFVYLLEKIRKVSRECVFLLIPISYLELHYQHFL